MVIIDGLLYLEWMKLNIQWTLSVILQNGYLSFKYDFFRPVSPDLLKK